LIETLADEVARVVAEAEALVQKSEDRAGFRREHGRDLSKAHKEALGELVTALDTLRDRLRAILGPDPKELKAEFEAAVKRLEELP
jgi:molecular chaperone GrpE (heat shock protein)